MAVPEEVIYDSREELLFSFYVEELLRGGWLMKADYQPAPFELSDAFKTDIFHSVGENTTPKEITLLRPHMYTADWLFTWNKEAEGIFFYSAGDNVKSKTKKSLSLPYFVAQNLQTYIDVKGKSSGRNNTSAVTFPLNQKWVMSKYGVYVQKVIVSLDESGVFAKTFTPHHIVVSEVYKVNGKGYNKGDSKLKYQPISIDSYGYRNLP
jgi:hypothetical protein